MSARISAIVLLSLLSAEVFAGGETLAEKAPETMQARVLSCAVCHGANGQGIGDDYFPRLAGKPAGYLYNQLLAFRDGRRQYPPMNYLLAYLSDPYLRQIAMYFAAERSPFPAPTQARIDAATLALGKSLVGSGDDAHKIPACINCHGIALTGMEPAIPGLLGLHADYLSAQLGAWRYGTRNTVAPDCMHDIATRLHDRDITAIAAYLASQPAPENPVPIAAGSLKMPLACGSVTTH